MTTAETLQIAGAVVGAAGTAISACERRLLRRLEKAGATGPESAVVLGDLHAVSRWRLARLRQGGAVVPVDVGRYYLDRDGSREMRRRRRRRALWMVAVATLVVLVVWRLF